MAIGRTDERQNPLIPVAIIRRRIVWMSLADPIGASGHDPASKAGHMTAFEPKPVSCKTYLNPTGHSLITSLLSIAFACFEAVRAEFPSANARKSRYFPNNRTQWSVNGISSRLSLLIVELKPRSRKAGRRRRGA